MIENVSGVTWTKTDYSDKKLLTSILGGVHTVLSFVGGPQDPSSAIQKNLIDAAVAAGVQRFAPSEWSRQVSKALEKQGTVTQRKFELTMSYYQKL